MKMVTLSLLAAPSPASPRVRAIQAYRRLVAPLVALSAAIDERRALRDRMNHDNATVDSAFWIYLR